jgi:hypothetical protein
MSLPFWVVYMSLPLGAVLGLYHSARAIPDLLKPPKPAQMWGSEFETAGDANVTDVISSH